MKFEDLSGRIFGNWEVLYLYSKGTNQATKYHCKCLLCGKEYNISRYSLVSGKSTKCRSCATSISRTKEYSGDKIKILLKGMKQRCYNPNTRSYKDYGARGIAICDEWLNNPESFYSWAYENGYGEGQSIERIDVNKGYSPDNCTFIPLADQSKNRRNCHIININGEEKCLTDWCRVYNINFGTVLARHKKGMDWIDALSTPVKNK